MSSDKEYEGDSALSEKLSRVDLEFWDDLEVHGHDQGVCFSLFVYELSNQLGLKLKNITFEAICEEISACVNNKVFCSLFEVKKAIDDLYKIVQNFEEFGVQTGKLRFGNFEFCVKIEDLGGGKNEISRFFESEKVPYDLKLTPELVQNFCLDLEKKMETSYEEQIELNNSVKQSEKFSFFQSSFFNDVQDYRLRKGYIENISLKNEVEKNKAEVKVMKGQIKAQLEELKNRLKKLDDEENILRNEKIKMEDHRKNFESKLKEFEEKKLQILNLTKDLRFPENQLVFTQISEIDRDIEYQTLLKELETFTKKLAICKTEEKDSLNLSISQINNKLASLKPEKIPNKSNKNLNKKPSLIDYQLRHSLSIKSPLPRLPQNRKSPVNHPSINSRRSANSPINLKANQRKTSTYSSQFTMNPSLNSSPRNLSQGRLVHMKSDNYYSDVKTVDYECKPEYEFKEKGSSLKETRLIEKEEELLKKEKWITMKIDKKIGDREISSFIKEEKLMIDRKKKEVEAKEKETEKKWAELERAGEKIASREREMMRYKEAIEQVFRVLSEFDCISSV